MGDKIKMVVVGQTPPPLHGQSIMIQNLLDTKFRNIEMFHVRMSYSKNIEQIGRPKPSKLLTLAENIIRVVVLQMRYRASVLYYPPSGLRRVALIRDILFLICVRPFFGKVVFHFHAGGMQEGMSRFSRFGVKMFHRAFDFPDGSISLSQYTSSDAEIIRSRKSFIVPYGIQDSARNYLDEIKKQRMSKSDRPVILFVGILTETKGVMILFESMTILKCNNIPCELRLVGGFESSDYESKIKHCISDKKLDRQVTFCGVKNGTEKWEEFVDADIFCFPTFYENETFGLVTIEAMQFCLPVVASTWRALPSIVQDGKTGLLCKPADPESLAESLSQLLCNYEQCRKMGELGRERYLNKFTNKIWQQKMEEVIMDVAGYSLGRVSVE